MVKEGKERNNGKQGTALSLHIYPSQVLKLSVLRTADDVHSDVNLLGDRLHIKFWRSSPAFREDEDRSALKYNTNLMNFIPYCYGGGKSSRFSYTLLVSLTLKLGIQTTYSYKSLELSDRATLLISYIKLYRIQFWNILVNKFKYELW